MAVTIDAAALTTALRLGTTTEEAAEVERLRAFASVAVERHLGAAFATTPEAVVNEAVVRLAGMLFDMPLAGRGAGYADVLRNSGALAVMAPWRTHRAGSTGEAEAEDEVTAEASGGDAIPGVVSGETMIVTVGSTPAPVATRGVGRYLVRSRGPAVVFVAVGAQSPGDGITLNPGAAIQVLVDSDAGTRLWLWTDGSAATAAVVSVQ